MNKNSIFPLRQNTEKKSNKMWVPILTTVGISAAMYGLRKFKDGKYMTPIQNFMKKFQNTGIQNVLAGSTANPLTEFSQELSTIMASGGSNQNNAGNMTQQNATGTMQQNTTGTAQQNATGTAQQNSMENSQQTAKGNSAQQSTASNMNSQQNTNKKKY
ncbi:hypothetical protein ACFFF5_02495 [Lederbergia wuyishanensis]|uniref:Uncharacterized protein n=1 Tax=Lederbergia wuyishanensis TaxID=1347903 RepID=A0ABU0D0J2_9BACI|nr:hypothetical protein [Lederbergia wuyishanensis]MCJ8006549.1 hypothetical protein [Lederbergia wuyishanensis]MDQ0341928.1 hypothetical protein [Lederbergia wuyishanensis]